MNFVHLSKFVQIFQKLSIFFRIHTRASKYCWRVHGFIVLVFFSKCNKLRSVFSVLHHFTKVRDCSGVHNHEGTNAKLRVSVLIFGLFKGRSAAGE